MGLKEAGLRGSLRSVSTGVSAIPDSEADQKLIHRWVLDDVNGVVQDSIGDADGTNNGVSSVSGDWAGGSAGDSDGVDDDILTSTLGNFGSNMDSDFAIAFSIQTTDGDDKSIINYTDTDDDLRLEIRLGHDEADEGEFWFRIVDSSGRGEDNEQSVYSAGTSVDDGNKYRIVLNKSGTDSEDVDIWLNQSEISVTNRGNGNPTDFRNFDNPVPLFARNLNGSVDNRINAILDDVCFFDNSLTQTEIGSYDNPWD